MRRRRVVGLLAVTLLIAACGDVGSEPFPPSDAPTPATGASAGPAPARPEPPASPTSQVDPLIEWCGSVAGSFCVWGVAVVFDDPGRLDCLLGSTTQDGFLNSPCNRSDEPPVTTIPGDEPPEEPDPAAVQAHLDAMQRQVEVVLSAAQPRFRVEAAAILDAPATLPSAMGLIAGAGLEPVGAWRSNPVCIDGYAATGAGSNPFARRFAYIDGAARAAALLAEAEASGTPISGRLIFDAHLAEIELASEALRADGVTVEAVLVTATIDELATLGDTDGIGAVRVLLGSPEWALGPLDLGPPSPVACASG